MTETLTRCKVSQLAPPQFRHEVKYEADPTRAEMLRLEVSKLLPADAHAAPDGSYQVKSLYFETPVGRDYWNKELGACRRQKLRLRTYGKNSTVFKLELKRREGDVSCKYVCTLTEAEARRVAVGDYEPLLLLEQDYAPLLYSQLVTNAYRPAALVAYTRHAYAGRDGDFRITFDSALRTGTDAELLFEDGVLCGASDQTVIEVKYNSFIPTWIKGLLRQSGMSAGENSKYGRCFSGLYGL